MMKKQLRFKIPFRISFVILAALYFSFNDMSAATYYVATNGSDSNNGASSGAPFLTISYAIGKISAGDTLFLRGGVYVCTSTIKLSKSGSVSALYRLFAYPGDSRPVIDFSSMSVSSSNRGVSLQASYWHIKGLRIKGAGDNGMNISGSYNIVEFCDFFENRDAGCQLGGGAHDNKIINCDSYWNADYGTGTTTNGGNADGFSPKLDVGTGNYFYGCRAWLNSDDGWDGYLRPADSITTTLENCWTWKNGYLKDGVTTTSSMNGNGFKMGGSDTKTLRHNFILKKCMAFNNKANGFDQNSNTGSITIYNATSFNNSGKNFYLSSNVTLPAGSVFTVKNCVAMGTTGTSFRSGTVLSNNQFGATSANFVSTDTLGVTAPRKADGSLPDITLMHPAIGSPLIDAGIDVGLPFNGSKPDLGYFETATNGLQYILTTGVSNGSGTVAPGSGSYDQGTAVKLTATPATGYIFDKWTDGTGATISTYDTVTLILTSNKTIKGNFKLNTGMNNAPGNPGDTFEVRLGTSHDVSMAFHLVEMSQIHIRLYNTLGWLIGNFEQKNYTPGDYIVSLTDRALASGVYLCRVATNDRVSTYKFVVQ